MEYKCVSVLFCALCNHLLRITPIVFVIVFWWKVTRKGFIADRTAVIEEPVARFYRIPFWSSSCVLVDGTPSLCSAEREWYILYPLICTLSTSMTLTLSLKYCIVTQYLSNCSFFLSHRFSICIWFCCPSPRSSKWNRSHIRWTRKSSEGISNNFPLFLLLFPLRLFVWNRKEQFQWVYDHRIQGNVVRNMVDHGSVISNEHSFVTAYL